MTWEFLLKEVLLEPQKISHPLDEWRCWEMTEMGGPAGVGPAGSPPTWKRSRIRSSRLLVQNSPTPLGSAAGASWEP